MTTQRSRRFALVTAFGLASWILTSVLIGRRADLPAAVRSAEENERQDRSNAADVASLMSGNDQSVFTKERDSGLLLRRLNLPGGALRRPDIEDEVGAAAPPFGDPRQAVKTRRPTAALVLGIDPNIDDTDDGGGVVSFDADWPDVESDRVQVPAVGGGKENGGGSKDVARGRSRALPQLTDQDGLSPVNCIVNDEERVVPCLRNDDQEVFLPFSFIKDYFEVYGELSSSPAAFYIHHAKQESFAPTAPYSARGSFLFFANYHVAEREKVLCISGKHGVPVSNQWDRSGYYYPIQIVQYGLSHYSQYVEGGPASDEATTLEDGNQGFSAWVLPPHADAGMLRVSSSDHGQSVVEFNVLLASVARPYLPLRQGTSVESCLSFDVMLLSDDAAVAIVVAGDAAELTIEFSASEELLSVSDAKAEYGLSRAAIGSWRRLHRDVFIDVQKALQQQQQMLGKRGRTKATAAAIKFIDHIAVRGHGLIDNVTVSSTCHMGHFFDAADWIERNQDKHGGWPIPVRRAWRAINATLAPGWYSAMAQGHALSILSRAYALTGETRYASAAHRALAVYRTASSNGGVRAVFMGQHPWYEEYPTSPALLVLNGFVYSLFGLYDLKELTARGSAAVSNVGAADGQSARRAVVADDEELLLAARQEAADLWEAGLRSLKVMLPFYDSGTGSFYDLRHYTMGVAPNRARWDYHAVHVGQLRWLGTVDRDPIFNATASRWDGYMRGHLAPHN